MLPIVPGNEFDMSTRMKDIADDLGVSIMTVSNVLRNRGRIGAEMRERIMKRAKELNYTPDLTARGLATGRTCLIGMIVPDLMHPFFAAIAKELSRSLRCKGYGLVISSSDEDMQLEYEETEILLARRVDAIILASSFATKDGEVFRKLEEAGTPFVLLDRQIAGLRAPFVGSDNVEIGKVATAHLIERGYSRIAHIGIPNLATGRDRLQGFKSVLQKHRRALRPEYIATVESTDERGEECGFEAMKGLLALRKAPDAVFCFNDIIAAGALKAASESGRSIPADLAIIGVSNLSGLSFWNSLHVSISSIDQNVLAIAEKTAQTVLNLLSESRTKAPENIFLPVTLIARDST